MDELLGTLHKSHITLDESDISLKHPRYCELLRKKPDICDQKKRRKEWLENLKRKRENNLNQNRGIKFKNNEEYMDVDKTKKRTESREYKGWLMLSEWLIEVPEDLNENWICSICPEGTRALVVAEFGKTMAYRRNGRTLCDQFSSALPGGSKSTFRGQTILDTVFHQSSNAFYILDVIFWGIDAADNEAQMRFYWLESKFQENLQLKERTTNNRYKFIPVEHLTFTELKEKIKNHPAFPGNNPKVDGILFYHREGTYVHSRSPLVTWLNPFMLPDILHMKVSSKYLEEMPDNYVRMEAEEQN